MRFHIKEKKHQDEIKQLVQSKDIDVMFRGKRHDVHFDMVRLRLRWEVLSCPAVLIICPPGGGGALPPPH